MSQVAPCTSVVLLLVKLIIIPAVRWWQLEELRPIINTAHGYLSTYNIVLVKYNQMLLKFLRFFAV